MPNQRYSSKDSLNRIPLNSTNEAVIFVNERYPSNIDFTFTFSDRDLNTDFGSFFLDEDDDFFFIATDNFSINDDNEFFDFTTSSNENHMPPFTIDLSSYYRPFNAQYSRSFNVERQIADSLLGYFHYPILLERSKIIEIYNNFNVMKKNQIKIFKEIKVHRNYVGHKIIDNNIINATFYNLIRIQTICYYKVKRHEGKKKKAHAYYRNSFIHCYCLFL